MQRTGAARHWLSEQEARVRAATRPAGSEHDANDRRGGRQRYLNRSLDVATLGPAPQVSYETWSDYDGNNIYGDFRFIGGQWTQLADYEPGVARSYNPGSSAATAYYHQDLLGSTRMVTGSGQSVSDKQWYSAFGESGTSEALC